MKNKDGETFLIISDLHYPHVHMPTWNCIMDFLRKNPIDGLVFLGDQFENDSISHWTAGKPGLRKDSSVFLDEENFKKNILQNIYAVLSKDCKKVWLEGNHDDRINQLYDEQPELRMKLDRIRSLQLLENGWKVIPRGESWSYGKLTYIHGDTLSSQAHAKKAAEVFCRNVVYGHFHTPQSWTKVLPHDQTQKWMAQCLPIAGAINPGYLKNKPTNWVSGFGVVEYFGKNKYFNLYPVVVTNGKAQYGGVTYGN